MNREKKRRMEKSERRARRRQVERDRVNLSSLNETCWGCENKGNQPSFREECQGCGDNWGSHYEEHPHRGDRDPEGFFRRCEGFIKAGGNWTVQFAPVGLPAAVAVGPSEIRWPVYTLLPEERCTFCAAEKTGDQYEVSILSRICFYCKQRMGKHQPRHPHPVSANPGYAPCNAFIWEENWATTAMTVPEPPVAYIHVTDRDGEVLGTVEVPRPMFEKFMAYDGGIRLDMLSNVDEILRTKVVLGDS